MLAPDLDRASSEERRRVALRITDFDEPLQRDQHDNNVDRRRHAEPRARKAAVNPGPSADIRIRCPAARQFMRSRTKSAVTADMLPKSRSTLRLSTRPPDGSSRTT